MPSEKMGWMRGRGGTVTFVVMGFVTAGVIKWIHQSQVGALSCRHQAGARLPPPEAAGVLLQRSGYGLQGGVI